MDLGSAAAFTLTALAIEVTPGPNMVWLATLALSDGRRAGYAAVAGVALGLGALGAAAGIGLGALLAASPSLYAALHWAGVAYLAWLAWQTWRGADHGDALAEAGAPMQKFFTRGLITNLLNPKALVFYITVLPAFLTQHSGAGDSLALGAIYVAVATAVHAAIVTAAGAARGILHVEARMQTLRRALALLLGLVVIWLATKA